MSDKKRSAQCFVIMPISQPSGYENDGHFGRVLEHLIKPACEDAGVKARRADEGSAAELITPKILNGIAGADIVVCDLSSKNPNVLYELGVAHSFGRRTVLIRDDPTQKIFDLFDINTIAYDRRLLPDNLIEDREKLSAAVKATLALPEGRNSMLDAMGLSAAVAPRSSVSPDMALLLEGIRRLSSEVSRISSSGATADDELLDHLYVGRRCIGPDDRLWRIVGIRNGYALLECESEGRVEQRKTLIQNLIDHYTPARPPPTGT